MSDSNLVIILLIIIIIVVILYFMGRKSVHHEIMINTSPEVVWAVLVNTDKYDDWNPVMKLLDGKIKEGNKVKYQFTQDENNISAIPSKVKKVITYQLLNQGGGLPFILTFDHQYILESIENQTKLTIHEDYEGIGVNFWNPAPIEVAYGKLNEAIKKRAESFNWKK